MKPAAFEYHAPRTVEEALSLLHEHQDEAKVLAGGQSLVPAMNFRLARPAVLVDITPVPGLDRIDVADPASVTVGARVRHLDLEHNTISGPLGRLLARTGRWVGHYPIRVRGTFGGSLAHADPAAEWCALACALDAEIHCRSASGSRVVGASDFFEQMAFTTCLEPDELLVGVRLPRLSDSWGVGMAEFARRWGDFAIVLAIAAVERDGDSISRARIALGGVAGGPVRASNAEAALSGRPATAEAVGAAAAAAAEEVDPTGDIHGSADYRRDLVRAMVTRALDQALA